MGVVTVQNRSSTPVDLDQAAALGRFVLAAEGLEEQGLSVVFLDDPEIEELNVRYLQHEGPADVLAFDLRDEVDPDPLLGEVAIGVDMARRQAAERELPEDRERLLYLVHGILHLAGFDDHDPADRQVMEARQEELLSRFLASDPDHSTPSGRD